jgi:hypothetical protein
MPHVDQSERTAGYAITSTLRAGPLTLLEVQNAGAATGEASLLVRV